MYELTVILKDEERTYRHKFLGYEAIMLDERDPYIQQCIKDAMDSFKGEPDEISIKITMEIQ